MVAFGSLPLASVCGVVLSPNAAGVPQAAVPPPAPPAKVAEVQDAVTAEAGMTEQLVSPEKDELAALTASVHVLDGAPLMVKLTVIAGLPATLVTESGLPEAANVMLPGEDKVGPVVVAAAAVGMVVIGVSVPGRRGF